MRISDWSSDVCSSDLLRQWPRASPDRRTGIVATKLPPRLAHLLTSIRSRSCAGHGQRLVRNSENKTLLCHRPTCALAIHLRRAVQDRLPILRAAAQRYFSVSKVKVWTLPFLRFPCSFQSPLVPRSEERSVGKGCVSTCRSRG